MVASLLLAAFSFAGGTPGELANQLALETRHDWVCGVGLEGKVEKFTIPELDPALEISALADKLAEATGRLPSSLVGGSPPQLIVSLPGHGVSREQEYIEANVLDPEAIRWSDDGTILFGPTGKKCVSWEQVARALPDEKLEVHWLYTRVYMAGVASHVDVPAFLSLLAASVGAKHVESEGVHRIEPFAPAVRGQLAAIHLARSKLDKDLLHSIGKFSLAVLRDIPDAVILQAVETPDSHARMDATLAQRDAILEYVLAMKKVVPDIVKQFEDAGCFSRPYRISLQANGLISAMFEGPPGPKKIYYFL
ncbi:MAG: hypothetical protein IT207_03525 [Fimbriimonadaceae bacterium]|nr:hypothetical protein [Fimbriimonadaceae bacterium]